jgi:uncharacterized protein
MKTPPFPEQLVQMLELPPPPGRSRESSIRLDGEGHFHHDGERFGHAGLSEAMHSWITRHPKNGRLILYNGFDWSYFLVDDAPYTVRHIVHADIPRMHLSDETAEEEPFGAEPLWQGTNDALYTWVKRSKPGGPYVARFSRHAQTELSRYLQASGESAGAELCFRIGDRQVPIGLRPSFG